MIIAGIMCDKCNYVLAWHHEPKWLVVSWAREKGWSIGKQTLCPKCRRKCKPKKGADT